MTANKLNPSGIAGLHEAMAGHIERGDIPGIVTLIGRGGEVHVDAVGTMTIDGNGPMRRDTIFRIASISKPITAAANHDADRRR